MIKTSLILSLILITPNLFPGIAAVAEEEGPGEHVVWFKYTGIKIPKEDKLFYDWRFSVSKNGDDWLESQLYCSGDVYYYGLTYEEDSFTELGCVGDLTIGKRTRESATFLGRASYTFLFLEIDYGSLFSKKVNILDHGVHDVNKWIECTKKDGERTHYYSYRIVNKKPKDLVLDGPLCLFTGQPYTFKASAEDPEEDSLYYMWFVDGLYQWGTTSDTFTYVFTETGKHLVTVKCQDWYGAFPDPVGFEVDIEPPQPGPEPDLGDDNTSDGGDDSGLPTWYTDDDDAWSDIGPS